MNRSLKYKAAVRVAVVVPVLLLAFTYTAPAAARYVAILAALAVTVVLHHRKRLLAVLRTLPRDVRFLYLNYKASRMFKRFLDADASVVSVVEERARTTPNKTCFVFEREIWTYQDVNNFSNRVARAFQRAGLERGDAVALVMSNQVEYVCVCVGLAKLGAVTALINTNLRLGSLTHCINTARPRAVIFGREYADAILDVRADLKTAEKLYHFSRPSKSADERAGDLDWAVDLAPLLEAESVENPAVGYSIGCQDPIMFIYTSGTTGLPKAAIVTHARVLYWPVGSLLVANLSEDRDAMYCPLPLYHGAAGAYAASLALCHGVPVIYAEKFSASRFWSDCVEQGATCAQYIGELCRFLVATPETPAERRHKVRVLLGNGMSRPVWEAVRQRFDVKQVVEFYGSTEGNVMFVNLDGKMGAVGFIPRLLPDSLSPIGVVRVDQDSGEPVRDAVTGFCIRCDQGEDGMAIGRIDDAVVPRQFVGYVDRAATEKKILRDAFESGDRYFMSGDMVVMDELGYIYFKDRIGDTFRWKGENVSTAEIEAVLTSVLLPVGVREVAVYGVQIRGHEGRAGMAAIADPECVADLGALAAQLTARLPSYARPLFVRRARRLPMTGTHKVSKSVLQRQGFEDVEDPVCLLDARSAAYVPLTPDILDDIREGRVRL